MTKRDVCIWFCRVVALSGMLGDAFSLLSGLIGWRTGGTGNVTYFLPALALYGFVWLFVQGIGTELAAEGEHGPPLSSAQEIGSLLVRCAGFWLFLTASLSFGVTFLGWAYDYFVSKSSTSSYSRFMMPYMIGSFVQSVLGFILAFTPRLRLFLRR